MVGLVIVSHSGMLAKGVRELAEQMVQGAVGIATAGGMDDVENSIGTDAMRVLAAIEAVYDEDGVVVLMDLGSALMSAEMAIEFLEPEQQGRVFLCSAPLVEGAVAAAVAAMGGATAEDVMREAQGALAPKRSQLGDEGVDEGEGDTAVVAPSDKDEGAGERLVVVVPNKLGLHARPAARLVGVANRFEAALTVQKGAGGTAVNGKSLNRVATLGARQGDELVLTARGADAGALLAAVGRLAEENFGDVDGAVLEAEPSTQGESTETGNEGDWRGLPASPGVAVGRVGRLRREMPEVEAAVDGAVSEENREAEWARLETAVAGAVRELGGLAAEMRGKAGAEGDILAAQGLILQDPELLAGVRGRIERGGQTAVGAWWAAVMETAEAYENLADGYLRERAADVRDAGARVVRGLLGVGAPRLAYDEPVILVAESLSPSETARLTAEQVLGIVTGQGGVTSHSVILARALGIPAVVGLGEQVGALREGELVGLDGDEGRVWPHPTEEERAELARRREAWLAARERIRQASQKLGETKDGVRVEVAANIGKPEDVAGALREGAEGVGLFRTEFLFMGRASAPSEAEQTEAYMAAAGALGERPLVIRTLDVGGDKPIAYLPMGAEENPFLGWRGIRFCLGRPDFFKVQLRAVWRTRLAHANVKLMFPMVGTVAELREAKRLLAEARVEVGAEVALEVGMMVEVPAAVFGAETLAREVDFFSIGTNDLTQYVMAADRGNGKVAGLADGYQPAVWQAIAQTAMAAENAGIWVGMCGELAGDALAAPALVGLGLRELSMSGPRIAAVKTAIGQKTVAEMAALGARVLAQVDVAGVRTVLEEGGKAG